MRICHIVETAGDLECFIAGRDRADLDTDRMLLFAVVRAIEVIAAAASKISPEVRRSATAIPWREVAGMRDRVVQPYFDPDANVLWRTARDEIPTLRRAFQELLQQDEGG